MLIRERPHLNTDPNEAPVRVVYVTGASRTGSTLLDIALSNHPEIVGVGELDRLPRGGWQHAEYCACGERVPDCAFWNEVRRRWCGVDCEDAIRTFIVSQRRFETFYRWPLTSLHARFWSDAFEQYASHLSALYKAVLASSGRRIVVDSSKNPARAWALAFMPDIDLWVLHLVRDGRAVALSRRRAYEQDLRAGIQSPIRGRPLVVSACTWIAANLLAEHIGRSLPGRYQRIRYEDLIHRPRETLTELGSTLSIDLKSVAAALAENAPLRVHHTVAGNRMRMQGEVRLSRKEAWRAHITTNENRLLWCCAGFLLRRYGYQRDQRAPS